jgi:hypothetical protein
VYTGQCPVLQGRATLNSLASGIRSAKIHRTVRCASGATTTSRQRSPVEAFNARQSAQKSGTSEAAHRTLYSTCPVRHRTSRRAQQSELQRPGDVAGAPDSVRCTPDCPVHHTPASFSNDHILIGGYKYHPNRPLQDVGVQATFQVI